MHPLTGIAGAAICDSSPLLIDARARVLFTWGWALLGLCISESSAQSERDLWSVDGTATVLMTVQ